MDIVIRFNQEKDQLLQSSRGISFKLAIEALKNDRLLVDIAHPSKVHPKQRLYIININNYAYLVPYVYDKQKNEIFLKTIYPSRKFTRIYLKGGKYDSKK